MSVYFDRKVLLRRPVLAAFSAMQMRAMEGPLHTLYIVSNCFQEALPCVGNLIFNSAIRFVNLNSREWGGCRFRLHIQDLIFARVPVHWRCLC